MVKTAAPVSRGDRSGISQIGHWPISDNLL